MLPRSADIDTTIALHVLCLSDEYHAVRFGLPVLTQARRSPNRASNA
jgi:hypothetical protein